MQLDLSAVSDGSKHSSLPQNQQHEEFKAVTIFATDRHSCFFCGYLGAITGINSEQQVFDQFLTH